MVKKTLNYISIFYKEMEEDMYITFNICCHIV